MTDVQNEVRDTFYETSNPNIVRMKEVYDNAIRKLVSKHGSIIVSLPISKLAGMSPCICQHLASFTTDHDSINIKIYLDSDNNYLAFTGIDGIDPCPPLASSDIPTIIDKGEIHGNHA